MTTELHKMLGDPGPGDTTWFTDRQNPFEKQQIIRQVSYKVMHWPELPMLASHRGSRHFYPHFLPPGHACLAFFEGFADEVLAYMADEDIEIHSEVLNLKSSQAACINFLFPLYLDHALAAHVLRGILPNVSAVTDVEFEYTGQDEKAPGPRPCTAWLGEPRSGKRGQNRTSIDAAIFWTDRDDHTHISLIEWKYTERSFGRCSAFEKAPAQTKAKCRGLNALQNPEANCLLAGDGANCRRRYWKHLDGAGISRAKLAAVEGCPFQGPFYQLMRQFLVAQFLREQHAADHVDVIAVEFEGNDALRAVPKQLHSLRARETDTVVDAWNAVIEGGPPLRRVTAERLMDGYDSVRETDPAWRAYIRDRYGL